MNFRFLPAFAALGCILLASCYPYDESQRNKPAQKAPQKTVTSAEQQKVQEQRERLKTEADLKKKAAQNETTAGGTETAGTTTGPGETPKPPVEEKRAEIAVASKVPGREGYVFSPFNEKLIDVRNIPSGTLVADPTYPESAKKHFRVP